MPREIPDVPKAWQKPTVDAGRGYDIELITPMFGGGVETRVNDPSFPVRPTAIRGQLQFWWRATVGAQFTTRQDLRAAQSAIWGSTERASPVQVLMESLSFNNPVPCAKIEWNANARQGKGAWRLNWQSPFNTHDSALPYAIFPFQGELPPPKKEAQVTVPPAHCIHRAKFRLILRSHKDIDFAKDVEPALWAWVNFGGVGSRTRRGCGSIFCKGLAPKDGTDLTARWKRYMPEPFPQREWPTMAESVLIEQEQTDAISGWDRVIGRFRHFRQGVGRGRNQGHQPNRPGRSRYPEPETIRTILWNAEQPWTHDRLEDIPNDAFPRAELGLPIVFHFQGQGEPPDTVLYPSDDAEGKKRERMASPLILKPLALENGKAIPLIMRLKAPSLTGVDLRRGDTSLPLPPSTVIRDARLSSYRDSPLAGSPNGSALEAFLAFARSEGFSEVTR